jgi:hypothetical protein
VGKPPRVTFATALIMLLLISAPGASAATEVGNDCYATTGVPGATLVQFASPGNPLPLTVPTGGVATSWTTKAALGIGTLRERLKVLRGTANPKQFQVVGESAEQFVVDGINSFTTRIPVQAGDRFGLFGPAPSGGLNCPAVSLEEKFGYFAGDVPMGSSQTFKELAGRVAVSAIVEPDADGDGFGDETQDRCTRSAAVQIDCPTLRLDAVVKAVGKSSAVILVATSADASIAVSGTAKLAGGSKKARPSAQAKLSAPEQTVTPGSIASFKLKFTRGLKSELARLPKGRSLKLEVRAEGKDLAGIAATDSLAVRLKGQLRGSGRS